MTAPASLEGCLRVVHAVERFGVTHVFGMPGTQTVPLFEALRRSALRTIVPGSELTAAFMAGAFYRASGRPALLVTIPGPGFAYALPGLAEARLDSAALIHLTIAVSEGPTARFGLQAIPQRIIAAQLAKAVLRVPSLDAIEPVLDAAITSAMAGEPGPVVVELAANAEAGAAVETDASAASPTSAMADIGMVWARLAAARRPLLYAGQGCLGSAQLLRRVVERFGIPVMTTPSARGVLPEDHPLALPFDPARGGIAEANAALAEADAVLVLGAKLAHNGSAGHLLAFGGPKTMQVDADPGIAGASYDVAMAATARTEEFLAAAPASMPVASDWDPRRILALRSALRFAGAGRVEPLVAGGSAAEFFSALRKAMPREAMLVTDTGMHQVLTRRHYDVHSPSGLLFPSDFQSMGFGLPAAIAAKLAVPDRPVVALVGDGSMAINGLELATAKALGISLPVLVFVDGHLNQIRLHQHSDYGRDSGVVLPPLDFHALADAAGVEFRVVDHDPCAHVAWALSLPGPSLLAVPVGDSGAMMRTRKLRRGKDAVVDLLGSRVVGWLKGIATMRSP